MNIYIRTTLLQLLSFYMKAKYNIIRSKFTITEIHNVQLNISYMNTSSLIHMPALQVTKTRFPEQVRIQADEFIKTVNNYNCIINCRNYMTFQIYSNFQLYKQAT